MLSTARLRRLLVSGLMAVAAACTADDEPERPELPECPTLDPAVEDLLTIESGVYGQATYQSDIVLPDQRNCRGYASSALPEVVLREAVTGSAELARSQPFGSRGFYEIPIEFARRPARIYYTACASVDGNCSDVFMVESAQPVLVRLDVTIGLATFWSDPIVHQRPPGE